MDSMEGVKQKLLRLLLVHSGGLLPRMGCPLDQMLLDKLSQGEEISHLADDTHEAFNQWFAAQPLTPCSNPPTPIPAPLNDPAPADSTIDKLRSSPDNPDASASPDQALQLSPNLPQGASPQMDSSTITVSVNGVVSRIAPPPVFPVTSSRTRLRTSFDQEHEVPRLQKWFEHNQHPCREQMIVYVSQLNALPSRQGRRPLDLTNIIYWFKNARAANRRAILAGREGCHVNMANFMDSESSFVSSENGDESIDDAFESDTTGSRLDGRKSVSESDDNEAGEKQTSSPATFVPELPNRNAVYVVTPIHHSERSDHDENIEVVNLHVDDDENSQSDLPKDLSMSDKKPSRDLLENGHIMSSKLAQNLIKTEPSLSSLSSDKENIDYNHDSNEVCDLSLPKKRRNSDVDRSDYDRKEPTKLSRLMVKTERDHEDGYTSSNSLSPSPRSLNSSSGSLPVMTSQQLSFQQLSQQALQMAAMSHALNMHYMHPAAALYGPHPIVHPGVHPPPPPIPVSSAPSGPPLMYPTKASPNMSSPLSGSQHSQSNGASSPLHLSADERKKRSRVFIDPLTEIPKLEKWFCEDTHPSSYMIEKYTEDLNMSSYRLRFPKLEPKNVQLWFKNHRAKVKRARLEQAALSQINNHVGTPISDHVTTPQSLPSTPSPITTSPMVTS